LLKPVALSTRQGFIKGRAHEIPESEKKLRVNEGTSTSNYSTASVQLDVSRGNLEKIVTKPMDKPTFVKLL
jgi:hypothetical protein